MRALAVPLLSLALAAPAAANGPDVRAALLAADRALGRATAERGLEGFLAGLAPDAALSRFGAPDLTGHAAIRAYLGPLFATPGLAFSWEPQGGDAAVSGDLGWTWGRYRLAATPAGAAPRQEEGYYVRVWRRPRPEALWQLAAEVINTRSQLPTGTPPAPPIDVPTTAFFGGDRAALMLADRDFDQDTAKRGAEGWVAWFAPDGIQVGTGDNLLRSHAEIRAEMAPLFADPANRLTWRPLLAEAAAAGDLGYTIGSFDFFAPEKPGAQPKLAARGRYLTVWKKQPDGSWRVVADIGNPYL